MTRGRLIVLDGLDGCGKTTQRSALAAWLPTSGLMPEGAGLICTREPGGTEFGQALRELLLHARGDQAPVPNAELLLYTADRAQHIETTIRPALDRGDWVLSDRFSGSTLAYQGHGRGLDLSLINQLEQIATGGLTPDLTLWLHLTVEDSIRRRRGERDDRIEAEGQAFLARVAEGFSVVAAQRNWCTGEAAQAPAAVTRCLQQCIKEQLE